MTTPRRPLPDLTCTRWRKSTYSGGNNECLEVADGLSGGAVPVRDSKTPDGAVLIFTPRAWGAFVAGVRA
ncbi:DUF397 domain-containing protein [Streptomyces sp. NPDC012769]|uniref:DUF397 domain-containing protein n=1 Tax=Streptomyces sp. NPDC012769 TaxID=3364848 RepID=UPI0036952130